MGSREIKKLSPPFRVRVTMRSLLVLRRDHAMKNLPKPGDFPKDMEESLAQGYDDAIRDAFLAFRHAQYDFKYLPGLNEVHLPCGHIIKV